MNPNIFYLKIYLNAFFKGFFFLERLGVDFVFFWTVANLNVSIAVKLVALRWRIAHWVYARFTYVSHDQNPPLFYLLGAYSKNKVSLSFASDCRAEPSLAKCMAKENLFVCTCTANWNTKWGSFPKHKLISLLVNSKNGLLVWRKERLLLHLAWISMVLNSW